MCTVREANATPIDAEYFNHKSKHINVHEAFNYSYQAKKGCVICVPHSSLLVIVYRPSAFEFADKHSSGFQLSILTPRLTLLWTKSYKNRARLHFQWRTVNCRPPFLTTRSVPSIQWHGFFIQLQRTLSHSIPIYTERNSDNYTKIVKCRNT